MPFLGNMKRRPTGRASSSILGYASSSFVLLLLAIDNNHVNSFVSPVVTSTRTGDTSAARKRALGYTAASRASLTAIVQQGSHTAWRSYGGLGCSRRHSKREQRQLKRRDSNSPIKMSISVGDLRITVTEHVSYAAKNHLRIETWRVDKDTGMRRTWTAHRSEDDFARLAFALRGALGSSSMPTPPPPDSSPSVFEGFLRRVLEMPSAMSQPVVYEFLEAPADVTQEPVLFGEVG